MKKPPLYTYNLTVNVNNSVTRYVEIKVIEEYLLQNGTYSEHQTRTVEGWS